MICDFSTAAAGFVGSCAAALAKDTHTSTESGRRAVLTGQPFMMPSCLQSFERRYDSSWSNSRIQRQAERAKRAARPKARAASPLQSRVRQRTHFLPIPSNRRASLTRSSGTRSLTVLVSWRCGSIPPASSLATNDGIPAARRRKLASFASCSFRNVSSSTNSIRLTRAFLESRLTVGRPSASRASKASGPGECEGGESAAWYEAP